MGNFLSFIFYLLGAFVTFCGILLYIYFKPQEKEEWGDAYPIVALLMVIMWPIAIIVWIANLIVIDLLIKGIILAIDKVTAYVAKKGESRQTKKRLTRNINKSAYYESENSK